MDAESNLYRNLGEIPKESDDIVHALKEILKFVQLGARFDLKCASLETVLALSGAEAGCRAILSVQELIINILCLLQDNSDKITKDAACTLINLSADKYGPRALLNVDSDFCPPLQTTPKSIVEICFKQIFDRNSGIADQCCMILVNLSSDEDGVTQIFEILKNSEFKIEDIVNIFTKTQYNLKEANLNYLGPWLSNMTQEKRVRNIFFESVSIVTNLAAYTQYNKSLVRRGGIVGVLRNLCFDVEHNDWLTFEADILPSLLLPLAGNEEFDDEDNENLPSELQYLPDDKQRETDPDIRRMLVEAITLLCTLKKNREYIRNKNTYIIMRELHKWEKDESVIGAVENLVDILIRTEEEIGKENLRDVDIPQDLEEKFRKMVANNDE
ncbi:protein HGH1 homolog [Harmonia axyridis]|uniref:protein HGH1 homolog n=1 Tax=Harmonia axyridis TaxID=115357 RepID=UPI001E275B60|nr:protein HGH1 homolog [Harmonia axyridis]